ncbi:hypothetical protein N9U99_02990 [Acidimicrobiaceae bacterium]|nr:hypothetical protein [Acidimicrobiaceae bacterium]
MNLNGFLNDSEKIIDSTPVYENKNSSKKLKRTKSKMILTDKHLYIDINSRGYLLKLRKILKINYVEANKSEIKIFESIDNESITNKSTVFFKFSNKYTEVLFSKPDVNIISYSSRAALTKVINPYADDDKFNKSTYIINSDFVEKIRSHRVN